MAFSVAQLRYGGGATAGGGGGRAIKCWVVFLGCSAQIWRRSTSRRRRRKSNQVLGCLSRVFRV
jgi:hypothetical protein